MDQPERTYVRLGKREWTDPEPETLAVSRVFRLKDSKPFIIFTSSSTWLTLDQAREVRDWLDYLLGDPDPSDT